MGNGSSKQINCVKTYRPQSGNQTETMENFVLGFFQEHLSRYIVGFRKEQINANLLNGKGEIKNVDLNCAKLNEELAKMTPYVNLERIQISRLSFHVESWTNLKNAPIHVDLEDIVVDINEPLHYLNPEDRDMILQLTLSEFQRLVAEAVLPKPRTSSYNLLDRILDNISIDIHSVSINYQTYGKFKTTRAGPWTPPNIHVRLFGIRVFTVDSFGYKNSEDIRKKRGEVRTMIYKKLETEFQISIVESGGVRRPIVQNSKLELQGALQRRLSDAEVMSLQMDVTIPNLEIRIENETVRPLAHFLSTLQYTLAKDRGFVDPLNSNHKSTPSDEPSLSVTLTRSAASSSSLLDSAISEDPDDEIVKLELSKSEHDGESPRKPASTDRILLVMPNGMVVHERASCSLSILNLTVSGVYKQNGHIMLTTKGAIVEAMWPKVTREKGGYIQASISYLSIQEQYDNRIRYLLVGGAQYNKDGPVEKPGKPLSELGRDETFPLYEDRCVRPDPIGLRHTFPSQAVGFKMTVGYNDETEIMVMNEIGLDEIDMVLDARSWGRVIQFANNVDNGGFDPRWHTGDWTDLLTVDMLLHPSAPLVLDEHLQPIKQLFLDENEFPSSDLFNATIRIRNACLRVPAAIDQDVHSCDIICEMEETMVVVSSALPRCLLSGEEDKPVAFPNDPSDISHSFNSTEDPSDRESGLVTFREISTFRSQLTMRGLAVKLASVIPFHESKEPQQLLLPAELTMILCFEGESPSDGKGLAEVVVVASVVAHRFACNLDFDLMVSAISTMSSHYADVLAAQAKCNDATQKANESKGDVENSLPQSTLIAAEGDRIESSLQGRKILVRRQLKQSRETGGVKLAVWAQVAESRFSLWRHNVPRSSPLRSTTEGSGEFVPVLRLLDCSAKGIDFGGETSFFRKDRRLMIRLSVGGVCLKVCSFRALLRRQEPWLKAFDVQPQTDEAAEECCSTSNMTTLVSFGETGSNRSAFSFRAEEIFNHANHCWALSFDCRDGIISCQVEDVEMVTLLVVEALLMPLWTQNASHVGDSTIFSRDTVGGLLLSMLSVKTADKQPLDLQRATKSETDLGDETQTSSLPDIYQVLPKQLVAAGLIPGSLSVLLLRCGLSGVRLTIPSEDAPSSNHPAPAAFFYRTEVSMGCFASDELADADIMNVYGRANEKWSTIAKSKSKGLFHSALSRQTLFFSPDGRILPDGILEDPLVGPFELSYAYRNAKVELDVSEHLSIGNIERLESLFADAMIFSDRCEAIFSNLSGILAPVDSSTERAQNDKGRSLQSPSSIACSSAVESIRSVKNWFLKVNESLATADAYSNSKIAEKEAQIASLEKLVFSKEKERLAALALVAAESRGWIRYGAPRQSGQRSMIACMLLPHWAILRRSLIILYDGPNLDRVVNMISLVGASINSLDGGQRIYDVKRAFAIVDAAGSTHCLSLSTDLEFVTWVTAIQTAIKVAAGSPVALEIANEPADSLGNGFHEPSEQSETRVPASTGSGSDMVVSKISTEKDSVEPETSLVSTRSQVLDTVHESTDQSELAKEIASADGSQLSGTGKQLRNRFTGVSQATRRGLGSARQVTKNRLGSALQAAKQKGKEVAERRRQRREDDVGSQVSVPSQGDASLDSENDGWPCQACTFLNSASDSRCLMCSTPQSALENGLLHLSQQPKRSGSYDNASTDSSTGKLVQAEDLLQELSAGELNFDALDDMGSDAGSEGVNSQGGNSETSGPRRGVRHRLGDAVKRARAGRENNKRLAFRKQIPGGDNTPTSIRVRNVSVGGQLGETSHPFSEVQTACTDLKRLEVPYHVTIEVISTNDEDNGEIPIASVSPDASSGLTTTCPEATTGGKISKTGGYSVVDDEKPPHDDEALSDAASEQSGSVGPDIQASLLPAFCFEVKAFSFGYTSAKGEAAVSSRRTIQDVVSLHRSMSESLVRVPGGQLDSAQTTERHCGVALNGRMELMLGLTPLDTVRATSKLLGGLLELPVESAENQKERCGYLCELITGLLNSLLECALPMDALTLLTDFLSLSDSSTSPAPPFGDHFQPLTPTDSASFTQEPNATECPVSRRELFSLSSLCETELMRAERQTILAEKLARSLSSRKESKRPFSIDRPSPSATRFQEAMHSTLMKVMAERDEAHARMVSSDVLHVHEMEQQRRKVEHVESQLDVLKRRATANMSSEREKREMETLRRFDRERQNDMDAELVSLCQQLAGEISARTQASLEIVRLKETRKAEQEHEAAEKQALKDEIVQLRQELEKERKKAVLARQESGSWRDGFEEVVKIEEAMLPPSSARVSKIRKLRPKSKSFDH